MNHWSLIYRVSVRFWRRAAPWGRDLPVCHSTAFSEHNPLRARGTRLEVLFLPRRGLWELSARPAQRRHKNEAASRSAWGPDGLPCKSGLTRRSRPSCPLRKQLTGAQWGCFRAVVKLPEWPQCHCFQSLPYCLPTLVSIEPALVPLRLCRTGSYMSMCETGVSMERVDGKRMLCLLAMEGLRMEENVVLTGSRHGFWILTRKRDWRWRKLLSFFLSF